LEDVSLCRSRAEHQDNQAEMKKQKLFVIRKYIMASDINEAIRLEKKQKPDDVWVDDDWKKANSDQPSGNVGYKEK
jgi:hypothetical protein